MKCFLRINIGCLLVAMLYFPAFGICDDIIFLNSESYFKVQNVDCNVKDDFLIFRDQKLPLDKNRGKEDLICFGMQSPNKKNFILVAGTGNAYEYWEAWLYLSREKKVTKLDMDFSKNLGVRWLNNEIIDLSDGSVGAKKSALVNIKQPRKYYYYDQLIAVDLKNGLYLCLIPDEKEESLFYLKAGKLFSDEIYGVEKIYLKDDPLFWGNVIKVEFLPGRIKVQYINAAKKAVWTFVKLTKKSMKK